MGGETLFQADFAHCFSLTVVEGNPKPKVVNICRDMTFLAMAAGVRTLQDRGRYMET